MAYAKVERLVQQAVAELRAGRPKPAEELFRQALSFDANYVPALGNLGALLQQLDRIPDAAECFRRICVAQPTNVEAYIRFGVCLGIMRRFAESAGVLREAVRIDPSNADAQSNFANAALELGELEDAERAGLAALSIRPRDATALSNLSAIYVGQLRFTEAETAARAAAAIEPKLASAYYNLGRSLSGQKRMIEGLDAIWYAVELQPHYPAAQGALATMLGGCGEATLALETVENALKTSPRNADLHIAAGLVYHGQGRIAEAIAHYDSAAESAPQMWVAGSNKLMAMHDIDQPDPRKVFEHHVAWAQQHADPLTREARFTHANQRIENRPLRIGYVSPDFRYHSVAHFLRPIIELHDRQQFEVFCYSGVAAPDRWTLAFQKMNVVWRDMHRMYDHHLAEQINADAIDIAVDCSGHTAAHRLRALAYKPAPVQATFLGYPNTTGMAAINYRITDAIADPPGESDQLHAEKLVRLNPTAWCYAAQLDAPERAVEREPGPIRFGSFSVLAKITPRWAGVWCEVLKRVPDSRMILKAFSMRDPAMRERMIAMFTAHGIAADRIELIGRQPLPADHLATYSRVDIALDTFPYNGTTTTCEAMYMGSPMVTLAGRTHSSRVGASLLSVVGLNELVANSEREFIEIAASLANDPVRLNELHSTLRKRMLGSPLMNAPAYVSELERAYRQMWRTWCQSNSLATS